MRMPPSLKKSHIAQVHYDCLIGFIWPPVLSPALQMRKEGHKESKGQKGRKKKKSKRKEGASLKLNRISLALRCQVAIRDILHAEIRELFIYLSLLFPQGFS
ncbi:hypothetical protein CEXT_524621 [Caerostris extrusa]|uniref:Uncharacterized protein n=1 Tax=Caerostris extrusa TaxID=172846 RepID=A0AAV4STJ7_CAEEX|nr:hypothetical protein CEXT_524621 [Caerostris extrusa]